MHYLSSTLAAALLLTAAGVQAEAVPAAVQAFKNSLTSNCAKPLTSSKFKALSDDKTAQYVYCKDDAKNIVYLKGPGSALADMDIDCDGTNAGSDGRCENDGSRQFQTSFKDTIAGYGISGVTDLSTFRHSYVVFGNVGKAFNEFNPRSFGIQELSVMAIVCGNKMFYGVWGDENGNDGPAPMIGEASLSLATACFGNGVTGDNGHEQSDVLYIAFPGTVAETVPGKTGANWAATSFDSFQSSIKPMGDKLIKRITGGSTGGGACDTCSWAGHCCGAKCTTFDDCSDELICTGGVCAPA